MLFRSRVHDSWPAFIDSEQPASAWALTTRGTRVPHQVAFGAGDYLVFGSETAGLPAEVLESFSPDRRLRLRIDALLYAEPAPEPVVFDTQVETLSGNISVRTES